MEDENDHQDKTTTYLTAHLKTINFLDICEINLINLLIPYYCNYILGGNERS